MNTDLSLACFHHRYRQNHSRVEFRRARGGMWEAVGKKEETTTTRTDEKQEKGKVHGRNVLMRSEGCHHYFPPGSEDKFGEETGAKLIARLQQIDGISS